MRRDRKLGRWRPAAALAIAGFGLLVGCEDHYHHRPPPEGSVVVVHGGDGFDHRGFYDDQHMWRGGYYDNGRAWHGDPPDWHH